MKYKFTRKEAKRFNKVGEIITVYGENVPSANVVHVEIDGNSNSFKDRVSTYIYYIVKGEGVFFLNDEQIKVKATDLVVIPPNTRIHYFGTMEMVLTTTPVFDPKNEVHIRMVDESENPLK